jgi:hypothetical protein
MKILHKALKLAYDRFEPNPYQRRYHFAIAFDGNKPVAISQNNPIKVNAKALKIGEHFNIRTYIEYPFLHAETNLVCNLWQKFGHIDSSLDIVVLRINRQGKLMGSKPCENCQQVLDKVNLTSIFWSENDKKFYHSFRPKFNFSIDSIRMSDKI